MVGSATHPCSRHQAERATSAAAPYDVSSKTVAEEELSTLASERFSPFEPHAATEATISVTPSSATRERKTAGEIIVVFRVGKEASWGALRITKVVFGSVVSKLATRTEA